MDTEKDELSMGLDSQTVHDGKNPEQKEKQMKAKRCRIGRCNICNEVFPDLLALKNHRLSHIGLSKLSKFVPNSQNSFNVDTSVGTEYNLVHGKTNNEKKRKKVFPDLLPLKNHRLSHIGLSKLSKFVPNSQNTFNVDTSFDTDYNLVHGRTDNERKSFECTICSISIFLSRKSLENHLVTAHEEKKHFQCKLCGLNTKAKSSLIKHVKNHSRFPKSEYHQTICSICSASFDTQVELIKHHNIVHDEKYPFKCDICKKGFTTSRGAHTHMQIHEKKNKCEVCNETFSTKALMSRHINQVHDCSICQKRFLTKLDMKNHRLSHIGESKLQVAPKLQQINQPIAYFVSKSENQLNDKTNKQIDQVQKTESEKTNCLEEIMIKEEPSDDANEILQNTFSTSQTIEFQATSSMATPRQAKPSIATPRQAIPSIATPSMAMPSKATPSMATPRQAICSICKERFQTKTDMKNHRLSHIGVNQSTSLKLDSDQVKKFESENTNDFEEVLVKEEPNSEISPPPSEVIYDGNKLGKDTPIQTTPILDLPQQATPIEATPRQATSTQATPILDMPQQATPILNMPQQTTPTEATPRQATPTHVTPIQFLLGGKQYTCTKCDHTFSREINLLEHLHSVHLKTKNYFCHICSKIPQGFSVWNDLKKHLSFAHNIIDDRQTDDGVIIDDKSEKTNNFEEIMVKEEPREEILQNTPSMSQAMIVKDFESESDVIKQEPLDFETSENMSNHCIENINDIPTVLQDPITKYRKPCTCAKSKCLKLYCECFANSEFCNGCNCKDCFNNPENDETRQKAITQCLERNPDAFQPKVTIFFS